MSVLLALLPLAACAFALAAARSLRREEQVAVAVAAALSALSALLSPSVALHDQWTHFAHARLAFTEPVRLLDPWDRPGFTLLYAAPAALGLWVARLASLAPAALAVSATIRAARALGLVRPWTAGLLLVAQYDFFGQASSTMTELPFAAGFAIAVWGWAEDRPWLAAAGIGWLSVTRPEGALFAAIGAAGLALRTRRLGPALASLLPLCGYLAAGALAFHGPLWFIRANPYTGLVGPRLEPGQLAHSFFYEALRRGQAPVLLLLEGGGLASALAGSARRLRFLLAPLAASFLLLTFLRIGETDAWRDSRYLVTVAPALALLATAGLDEVLARFPRLAPPALLALAAAGAALMLRWNWRAALAGAPVPAALLLYVALLAAAALLWLGRRWLSPRGALALLLLVPLAGSPPGAFGRHRPEPREEASGPPRART